MVQYEIKITGRVQGVGFRYFVQKHADRLGIKGWVKNVFDGSVLVMAQGEEVDIDTFLDYLRQGPPLARINNVIKYRMATLDSFDGFGTKY